MNNKAIFVIGATATGKTSLGVQIARFLQTEIISIDSRQVYRGLDLGTGKDLAEYGNAENSIKYHLIDICNPIDEKYNLYQFICDTVKIMQKLWNEKKIPVLVGGTSLYINALLSNFELKGGTENLELRKELETVSTEELLTKLEKFPDIFARTDKTTRQRIIRGLEIAENKDEKSVQIPEFEKLLLSPFYHRSVARERIQNRLKERLNNGMIEEVKRLQENGVSWEKLDWFGLEYRYVAKFLKGEIGRSEMEEQLLIKIHQFLKSQDIWLRKIEREGKDIYFLPNGTFSIAQNLIEIFCANQQLPEPLIRLNETHYGPKQ